MAVLLSGHWAAPYVRALTRKGVVSGFGNGLARPDAPVTRAEAAKVVAAAFGWSE